MAENISTIKSSGGDYTSLNAWENDKVGNITGGNAEVAECYNFTDTSAVNISGWTTDSDSYVKVTVPDAEYHQGVYSNGGYLRSIGGKGIVIDNGGIHLIIEKCRFLKNGTSANASCIHGNLSVGSSGYILIRRNIFRFSHPGGGRWNVDIYGLNCGRHNQWIIVNNIFYNFRHHPDELDLPDARSGIQHQAMDSNASIIQNNTFEGCDTAMFGTGDVFAADGVAKNNIAQVSRLQAYQEMTGMTTSNNISDDTSSPDTSYREKTVTFVDQASDNFLLDSSDTEAVGNGADLGADATSEWEVDILGRDRDAEGDTWDIGAHQTFSEAEEFVLSLLSTNTTLNSSLIEIDKDLNTLSCNLSLFNNQTNIENQISSFNLNTELLGDNLLLSIEKAISSLILQSNLNNGLTQIDNSVSNLNISSELNSFVKEVVKNLDSQNTNISQNDLSLEVLKAIDSLDLQIVINETVTEIESNQSLLNIEASLQTLAKEIDINVETLNINGVLYDPTITTEGTLTLNISPLNLSISLSSFENQIDNSVDDLINNIGLETSETEIDKNIDNLSILSSLNALSKEIDLNITSLVINGLVNDPNIQTDDSLSLNPDSLNLSISLNNVNKEIYKDINSLETTIEVSSETLQINNIVEALSSEVNLFTQDHIEIIKELTDLLIESDLEEIELVIPGLLQDADIVLRIKKQDHIFLNIKNQDRVTLNIKR